MDSANNHQALGGQAAGLHAGEGSMVDFDEHEEGLRKMVSFRLQGHEQSAVDDIMQEIAIAAQRAGGEDSVDRSKTGAWLRSVASNKINDYWRSVGRRKDLSAKVSAERPAMVEVVPSPYEWVAKLERCETVKEALERLPEADRRILEMQFFQGSSYEEIALEVGITVKALEYRLKVAKEKLRSYLSELNEF